jgi:CRP-like cAMP-binding protein
MRQPQEAAFGNCLLDALPPGEAARLVPAMRRVFVQRDQIVTQPEDRITFLHFPIDALFGAFAETTNTERATSILTVGRRGVVGLEPLLGLECAQSRIVAISPGSAWQLSVEAFERYNAATYAPLRRLLLRYAHACVMNGACRVACNAEHNVNQRLARWLLWLADETGRVDFAITHQQIAAIAAIRRPSVSLALSQFQREGAVRSQHGRVQLIGRGALEAMVCRCYWIISQGARSVFGIETAPKRRF